MGRDERLAAAYDTRFPDVDIPVEQKAERQERDQFRFERAALRRTNRTRGIVVPALPWQKEQP